MKYFFIAMMVCLARQTVMGQGASSGDVFDVDSIVAPEGVLTLASHQFSFTEGASVDRRGNIFFTDQPNNKIWEYDVKGRLSLFLDSAGRSNGMYFDPRGRLVTCADEEEQLWA